MIGGILYALELPNSLTVSLSLVNWLDMESATS